MKKKLGYVDKEMLERKKRAELPKRMEHCEKRILELVNHLNDMMTEDKKKWKMQMSLNKRLVREIVKLKNIK